MALGRNALQFILNRLPDAVLVKDKTGAVVYHNAAAETLDFVSIDPNGGQSLNDLFVQYEVLNEHGLPFPLQERLTHLIDGGAELPETTLRIRSRSRNVEYRSVVSAFPLPDENGKVEQAAVTFRMATSPHYVERQLQEQADVIETINKVGQLFSARLDLQALVQAITDAATALAGAEFGSFFYNVINDDGEAYTLYTLSGVPRELFANFPMPRNTHVFGPTFRGEGVVRSDDITKDPRYGQNPPFYGKPMGHLPVVSYLAVSVISRSEEVIGGLFFGHSKPGMFTEREEELVVGLAAQASIAMDNARLYAQVEAERERLQVTLTSIGDAVIATDDHGLVTFMNTVAETLTGWDEKSAVGQRIESVFHIINEATRQAVDNPVKRVIENGHIVGLANHTVLIARDGREFPIDDSGAPIYDTEGKLIGVVLVFRDVSLRQQAERALAESEQRYRLLFETARDAILVTDELGNYIDVNEAAEQMTGYSRAELLKMSIWDLSAPEVVNQGRTIFEIFKRDKSATGEYKLRHKNGTLYDVEFAANYVTPGHFQTNLRDVTERKQAERERVALLERERAARHEAEMANQLKLRFLAMISHELRTPLASIKGFTSTLIASDVVWSPEQQQEFLTILDDEANRLADLVDQLIDVTRINAGNLRISPLPGSLREILLRILPQLKIIAPAHLLAVDLHNDLPEVMVDQPRITQVITNLVDNAAKYSPEDTRIFISAELKQGWATVRVRDEGQGIKPEDREIVFEAFRQAERRQPAQRGAGLGLAICKGIIEAHGGKIWIEDALPMGTTLAFTLPVVQ